ncbi:winged helix-turn-helix transcriptional regulator [Sphingobacterium sp. MYb382]|uniref:winged helix-turn-helix transcriptional regulator n=1 Tax=Sphingobacterium sp. MYb382 TaxID=2745278 RepID=UPI0030B74E60
MKELKQRSVCPISCTLDFFGDKWSFLILRDMMFSDKVTFGDFLASSENIASNILTDRLKGLEASGFIFKHYVAGKARVGYSLTERGISLLPMVMEFLKWGVSQGFLGVDPAGMRYSATNSTKVIKKTTAKLLEKLALQRAEEVERMQEV